MSVIAGHYGNPFGDESGPGSGFTALAASVVLHVGAVIIFFALTSLSDSYIPGNGDDIIPDNGDEITRVDLVGGPSSSTDLSDDSQSDSGSVKPATTPPPPPQVIRDPQEVTIPPVDDVVPPPKDLSPETSAPLGRIGDTPPAPILPPVTSTASASTTPPQDLDGAITERLAQLAQQLAAGAVATDAAATDGVATDGVAADAAATDGVATYDVRVDPEQAIYYRRIRDIISRNWVAPANDAAQDLVAVYHVVIRPDGRVFSSSLVNSSGNNIFDLSVERAVKESSPFPPLPPVFGGKALTVRLNFSLNELRAAEQRLVGF